MDPNGPRLELSRAECLRLLPSVSFGRISYTRLALPAVEPVDFAVRDEALVMRIDRRGKLAAAVDQAVVAFQADDLDLVRRSGWSITVVGPARG